MRQRIILASLVTPALSFIAYLCYLCGFEGLALILGIAAFFILCAFPHKKEQEVEKIKSTWMKWDLSTVLFFVSKILFMFWLITFEAFGEFIDQLLSVSVLGDWRIISAVFIWHLLWAINGYKKSLLISDVKIVKIFEVNKAL